MRGEAPGAGWSQLGGSPQGVWLLTRPQGRLGSSLGIGSPHLIPEDEGEPARARRGEGMVLASPCLGERCLQGSSKGRTCQMMPWFALAIWPQPLLDVFLVSLFTLYPWTQLWSWLAGIPLAGMRPALHLGSVATLPRSSLPQADGLLLCRCLDASGRPWLESPDIEVSCCGEPQGQSNRTAEALHSSP